MLIVMRWIEMKPWSTKSAVCASLLSAFFIMSGCASSIYGWQVRTSSTSFSSPGEPAVFQQEPVALLSAVTVPGLRGNEVALVYYLHEILRKVTPEWKVVSPQETVARINEAGLAAEYMRMRAGHEESNILDRDQLRRIGAAIGARYMFQLRLASFTQTMTERWKALDIRLTQTRWGDMRLVLQLWDANTGRLVWVSAAETSMQGEGVSQDPVYLEDIARATLIGMMADFLNRRTASKYTPVNKVLDDLIKEAMPQEPNGK